MELDALRTFAKVAELASFTRAAEQLGLQKGRVSTIVSQLEAQLGTRLLQRTTRTVRLTPDGEQFFERCQTLLADADELQALFQQTPSALRGRLRIDLPIALARKIVIPRLPEFLAAHPGLEIELSTTDRRVDLIREGMDCKLRVGSLGESGLVARKLGELTLVNCASPAYLQEHGTPRTLADLSRHRLVKYASTLGSPPLGWEYMDGDEVRFHDMPGVVTVNSAEAYEAACLAGLGLIQAPVLGMREWIAEGKLVMVMPDFNGAPMPVSLLYAHRRHLPKRVQAFMAWLGEVLGPSLVT
ncbi:LysR family transcriptional regulator [Aquabacterium sp. CECT 9606]|uniref:LysR family transcriptional regulator n=1 Tax=Aquabacterium sp. CECT 9606 TaxID=2845822 RepID=UPI001E5B5125|nr:LysR family transcriptional regulator [Aquabacterium sp. CECT 9606]CAH0351004.1 HTH-type transcriptional regulator DmlR [Aquabacterium sp. CECT 9606]